MRFLVTGAAGFIGYHVARRLLDLGYEVFGFDNFNAYYDVRFKEARNAILQKNPRYKMIRGKLEDDTAVTMAFDSSHPECVIHLAAQAGVRHSITHPHDYINSNIVGFQNIIENVRAFCPNNFVYASSSSVYGKNELPFSESQNTSNPISLYAATKLSNEQIACAYGNMHGIKNTGLRFFTVYGPLGRPDMALFKFSKAIVQGKSIQLFNEGNMQRDFTFIEDIVDGIMLAVMKPQMNKIYNLGYGSSNNLMDVVERLSKLLDRDLAIDFLPMQKGDVRATVADISLAKKELGYNPIYDIENGLPIFCEWFKELNYG